MITSGGGPGVWGLLHSLRNLPGRQSFVVVQDCDAGDSLGTALGDLRAHLPPAADSGYIPALLAFCREKRVELLIPVFDGELLAVAQRRLDFEKTGTRVLLPPAPVVQTCVDKWRTYERLAGTTFVPQHLLVTTVEQTRDAIDALGYPTRKLCIRPVNLAGGRGVHILDADARRFEQRMLERPGHFRCTADEFMDIRRDGPTEFKLVVSEYLPGDDLGVDLLAERGEVVEMVIRRKRGPMLHGNPMRMEFRESPEERQWIHKLTQKLDLSGLVNVDAKYDDRQNLRLLEINARPSACVGMSCGVVNLLAWAIDLIMADRIVDQSAYYRATPARRAMRVLADVLFDANSMSVTPVTKAGSEVPADARPVYSGTPG